MKPISPIAASLVALSLCVPVAMAKDITLPPDGVQLTPSPLPGYAKAQANCTMCHSAEYMRYQPPNAARPYWDAMVHRMKVVFKAPIADEDMPEIVDYLARTYGNEQAR
jgi:sulfite dehydrogenase (cytochrome) subunit B